MKKQHILFIILFLVFGADLYLMSSQHDARLYSKALLMPLLAFYFFASKPSKASILIYFGLFFSWLGDILLMFDQYFIPGLISFLITHICYIIYFAKLKGNKHSYLQQRPVMLLVIVAYLVELLYMLWPGLGGLKVPVMIYAIVISTMFAMAGWQYEKIDRTPALYFIFGSFLFVFSDSVLAIGKFLQPLPYGGICVMSTYVAAQVLIVQGAIRYERSATVELA